MMRRRVGVRGRCLGDGSTEVDFFLRHLLGMLVLGARGSILERMDGG